MPSFNASVAHDHDCEHEDCHSSWSLYKYVDTQKVRCLNEAVLGSCQSIFKPWDQRLQPGQSLCSDDDDPELLIHVPFTGSIKLTALTIIGGPDVGDLQPVQEWDLVENLNGFVEYPTQVSKFNGVHSIDLYIPSNFGDDQTEIKYIGFKGEFSERNRKAVDAVYEARPVPTDHKVPDTLGASYGL